MSTTITAQTVKDVLQALAEDYIVDIPAVHNPEGYWIEYNQLAAALLLGGDVWFEEIAVTADGIAVARNFE